MEGSGLVAVVTGCGRVNGIGRAVARALREKGWRVVATVREVVDGVCQRDGDLDWRYMDLKDEKSVKELKEYVLKTYLKIDALINNAGILGSRVSPLESDPQETMKVFETNFVGTMMCIQTFLPIMSPSGRIINISSGVAQFSAMGPYTPLPYSISKLSLNALTIMFASQLSATNSNVKIFSLSPGFVKTDMHLDTPHELPAQLGMEWIPHQTIANEVLQLLLMDNPPTGTHWTNGKQTPF